MRLGSHFSVIDLICFVSNYVLIFVHWYFIGVREWLGGQKGTLEQGGWEGIIAVTLSHVERGGFTVDCSQIPGKGGKITRKGLYFVLWLFLVNDLILGDRFPQRYKLPEVTGFLIMSFLGTSFMSFRLRGYARRMSPISLFLCWKMYLPPSVCGRFRLRLYSAENLYGDLRSHLLEARTNCVSLHLLYGLSHSSLEILVGPSSVQNQSSSIQTYALENVCFFCHYVFYFLIKKFNTQ